MSDFQTSDFCLAITLALYFPLRDIDKSQSRFSFIFDDSEELFDKVKQFNNLELLVLPQDFFAQSREIKSRMYND